MGVRNIVNIIHREPGAQVNSLGTQYHCIVYAYHKSTHAQGEMSACYHYVRAQVYNVPPHSDSANLLYQVTELTLW